MSYDCYCDELPPSVFRELRHKCAKPFKCCECGRQVSVGETYRNTFGIWDGDPQTYKSCGECSTLLDWALISVPCFCPMYTRINCDILNMVRQVGPDIPGFFFEYGRHAVAVRKAGGRI